LKFEGILLPSSVDVKEPISKTKTGLISSTGPVGFGITGKVDTGSPKFLLIKLVGLP
jgi:hypothetical protein